MCLIKVSRTVRSVRHNLEVVEYVATETSRRVGYVRTSTRRQHRDLQLDAMARTGVTEIYEEQLSGSDDSRPVLAECLASLHPGDVLVVWRLDRLGRSVRHLLATVGDLAEQGVGFESLHDKIDTTSATGRLVFHVLAAISEFERALTTERIQAGVDAARDRGKRWGPKTVMTPERTRAVRSLLAEGVSKADVARAVGISRATLYRHLENLNA
jgi:DNA invertase Pin-like site-specific DNA recombinase